MPHPLDGVRPRHASCARCGYRFGGIPIRSGLIICPECGHANTFDPAPPPPAPPRRPLALRLAWYTILSALATLALFTALYRWM